MGISTRVYRSCFTPGTYLIDENTPIEPQSFMTLNLGGSTLKISNGLVKYAIVRYQRNQKFSRVTNGRVEGIKIHTIIQRFLILMNGDMGLK